MDPLVVSVGSGMDGPMDPGGCQPPAIRGAHPRSIPRLVGRVPPTLFATLRDPGNSEPLEPPCAERLC